MVPDKYARVRSLHYLPQAVYRPEAKPVKQKQRKMNAERLRALNNEVDRLFKVDFIRETPYPDWLASPVLVKKRKMGSEESASTSPT